MSLEKSDNIHWSFWTIGGAALIWNVLGAINFIAQMSPDLLSTYPASERAVVESRPYWATAGFAVAVFGGALGSLFLLMRNSAAQYLFVASLLGVVTAMTQALAVAISVDGAGPVVIGATLSFAVALFLVWYASRVQRMDWFN